MPNLNHAWKLSYQIPAVRRDYLLDQIRFEAIVESIASGTIFAKKPCKGKSDEVRDCLRPAWTISVSEKTCDQFFNSVSGYRANYLRSIEAGDAANRVLIGALKDRLLSAYQASGFDADFAALSLECNSAKAWISESFISFDHNWIDEILVPPWIDAANTYLRNKGKYPDLEKAIWGIRATLGTKIDIKGAFLNRSRIEKIPSDKIDRSAQIHNYGFS